ncbi:MAG: type VII toxin-antitoxin system HepT family RNase toxin [Candidatus Rokuibacteriota bacterium]
MVDRDLVLRKLADLDLYLSQVSEYRGITLEDYRGDWKVQRIVERTLQVAIEVCVDIANHVIADRGLRVPATYADAFDVIGEAGLLPGVERDAMVRMVGFRNVIVHEYARVDAEIVVRILREHLGDLAGFAARARGWL